MMRALEDRGLSASTRNAAKKVQGRALRRAMQEELVHRKVAAIADGAHVVRTERRSFTAAQARTLLQALRGDRLGAAYEVTLALGLRSGEVLGLSRATSTLTLNRRWLRCGAGSSADNVGAWSSPN
jgi:integrase